MFDLLWAWAQGMDFLLYATLYVMTWMGLVGTRLFKGVWQPVSVGVFFVIVLVRFVFSFKAAAKALNPKPVKLALWLDVGILVVSLSLLSIFKVEEPFVAILLFGSIMGSAAGLAVL